MQDVINCFLDILKNVYNNIELFEHANTIMDFITHIFPIIVLCGGIFRFIYNYFTKQFLKNKLSKGDVKRLKYYVTTHGQLFLPNDDSKPNGRIKRFDLINFFVEEVFKKDKYGKYFIVLAESGMGKSIFLQELFLKYHKKILKKHKIYFYPLTNEKNINEWKTKKHKNNAILLLDALDEDPYAIKDYENRIQQITKASRDFYKVIITCRTQFFPDTQSEPKDTFITKYDTRNKKSEFYKIYISQFNNEDIDLFLKLRFRTHKDKIIQAKKIVETCSDLMARPMILSFIDELLENSDTYSCSSDIYGMLIEKWIGREPRYNELLKRFAENVMRYMFKNNISYITKEEIAILCKKEEIAIINPILARTRSLLTRDGKGKYRFAHKSIYEYMISYEAIYNDMSIREKLLKSEKLIDLRFYREMSYIYIKEHNNNFKFLDLRGADLTGMDLRGADLTGTVLTYAVLTGTDLTKAILKDTILKGAILKGAILKGANLTGTDLTYAVLDNEVLTYAALTGANLTCNYI